MNIVDLEKRLKELKVQRDKNMALVNVIDGAMQDCEYWIMRLSQPLEEDNEPVEKNKKKEPEHGEADSGEAKENPKE